MTMHQICARAHKRGESRIYHIQGTRTQNAMTG